MTVLTCENLVVDLPAKEGVKRVVDDVSFAIDRGCIYDLIGPSGGGKTTVLLALARMAPIASGTITLDGKGFLQIPPEQWRTRVCLVPQRSEMIPGTVKDNLLLPWRFSVRKGQAAPDDSTLLEGLRMAMLEDVELDRDASRLSGGQSARVALVRAFLTEPDVLLLDEMDAALDGESSLSISRMTQTQAQKGAAILRIRHRAPDGLAASTFNIANGKLV